MGILSAFIACVLIWGSTWYAIEWQLGIVPAPWSVAYRFGLACLVVAALCLIRKAPFSLPPKSHLVTAGIGFFMFSSNYIIVYYGTGYLTSGLVAIAFSLLSFLNIISARLFLKTPIRAELMVAAVIGMAGLALIFFPEIEQLSLTDQTVTGLALCILSTLFASLGNTLTATERAKKIPLLPLNFWGMAYGTLFNGLFAFVIAGAPVFDTSTGYITALVYLSLFGSVAAFILYIWLVGRMGVGPSAYIMVLTPLVALTVSTLYEGFEWTGFSISGLALIIVGNVMMIRLRPKKPALS